MQMGRCKRARQDWSLHGTELKQMADEVLLGTSRTGESKLREEKLEGVPKVRVNNDDAWGRLGR